MRTAAVHRTVVELGGTSQAKNGEKIKYLATQMALGQRRGEAIVLRA